MRDWPEIPKREFERAIFLDRDGTLNVDTHYPHLVEKLELIQGAREGLAILAELPFSIIVVSNQAGIAQGRFTERQMSAFNKELRRQLLEHGGRIDAFYFCPHQEPKDLPREALPCLCSKPAPGMLLEAAKEFKLDLARSFLIGDKSSDIAAGKQAGCFTILVKTGKGGTEEGAFVINPDETADNLYDAALNVRSHFAMEDASSL